MTWLPNNKLTCDPYWYISIDIVKLFTMVAWYHGKHIKQVMFYSALLCCKICFLLQFHTVVCILLHSASQNISTGIPQLINPSHKSFTDTPPHIAFQMKMFSFPTTHLSEATYCICLCNMFIAQFLGTSTIDTYILTKIPRRRQSKHCKLEKRVASPRHSSGGSGGGRRCPCDNCDTDTDGCWNDPLRGTGGASLLSSSVFSGMISTFE